MAENQAVHDDLIDSGRRRLLVVSIVGILLLALALTLVVFPFAYAVGALGTLLRGSGGYGWSLIGISFGSAFVIAVVVSALGFLWVYRRAERTVLTPWRIGAVAQPRAERTGRSRVVNTSASPRRISVLVNGVPLNDPESHEVYWIDHPDLLASAPG